MKEEGQHRATSPTSFPALSRAQTGVPQATPDRPDSRRAASAPMGSSGPFDNLERHCGKPVEITRSNPARSKITGRVLFADTTNGMIGVVEDETLQLHIYHVHSLLQIDVIDDNPTDWTPSECAGLGLVSDPAALKSRQVSALAARQDEALKNGPPGTSAAVQALFDTISKTMSCRWKGNTIVVHDVSIEKPYRQGNCKGANQTSLLRVQKIVGAYWQKADFDADGPGDAMDTSQ
ncbi:AD domain-containing protein [Plasmodiophora brassicae]